MAQVKFEWIARGNWPHEPDLESRCQVARWNFCAHARHGRFWSLIMYATAQSDPRLATCYASMLGTDAADRPPMPQSALPGSCLRSWQWAGDGRVLVLSLPSRCYHAAHGPLGRVHKLQQQFHWHRSMRMPGYVSGPLGGPMTRRSDGCISAWDGGDVQTHDDGRRTD